MERDRKQAIEDTILTAYSAAAAGYGIDLDVLSSTARKRIAKTISDLTSQERDALENQTKYKERIKILGERLDALAQLSPKELDDVSEKVRQLAKREHITLEKAYELHGKN